MLWLYRIGKLLMSTSCTIARADVTDVCALPIKSADDFKLGDLLSLPPPNGM